RARGAGHLRRGRRADCSARRADGPAARVDGLSLQGRAGRGRRRAPPRPGETGAAGRGRREAWSQSARPGPGIISFAGGVPDSALFPTDAFRRVLNRFTREEGRELLQYYPSGGYPPLRQYLSGYLLRFGLEARPEDILIVNGTQQGFDLVARTLLDPGDFVA